MGWRRHPHPIELGAWFDGEGEPGIGHHLAACRRCQRKTRDLHRVRGALRGEPLAPRTAEVRHWPRWSALAPVAVVLVVLLVATISWDPINEPITHAGRYLTGQTDASAPGSTSTTETTTATTVPRPPSTEPTRPTPKIVEVAPAALPAPVRQAAAAVAAAATPTTSEPPGSGGKSDDRPAPDGSPVAPPVAPVEPRPLRLGSFVPGRGPGAGEGRMVRHALERAVESANRTGGIAGRPVTLVVADATDAADVAALVGRTDVLVGGFGATGPEGIPWLFPGEPLAVGDGVVPAELSPREAGTRLAEALAERSFDGTVGVVIGDGPDAALAEGLSGRLPVLRAPAEPGTTCDRELFSLRRRGVSAVAIAGSPELAAECADAGARMAWRPRGGMLLAPDAAYARLEDRLTIGGASTVLGLPFPTEDRPGAARYRADVGGPPSYRALVSYAGVELAVTVARAQGTVDPIRVRQSRWSSDLFDIGPGRDDPEVVIASFGRWSSPRRGHPRAHRPNGW